MSFSNYLEPLLLDHVFGGSTYSQPTNVFIKLHTGDPGEAGTSNAATETTRKQMAFAAASGNSKATNAQLQWTSVAGSETYTHFSIWDNLTAGNCLFIGDINPDVVVASGGTFTIASGGVTIYAGVSGNQDPWSDYLAPRILDHVFGGTTYTQPTNVFVKLHIGDPGNAGTSNAAAETTRKQLSFAAASAGLKESNAQLQWTSLAATETLSHCSVWDNLTAGNCLLQGPLTANVSVTIGGTFTIASGSFDISLD